MWPRPCIHQLEYAPGDLEPEEWYATFPEADEWAQDLLEAWPEEYEDREELGPPMACLDRDSRVTAMAERYAAGQSLWNPDDVTDIESAGIETTGKKKQRNGRDQKIRGETPIEIERVRV